MIFIGPFLFIKMAGKRRFLDWKRGAVIDVPPVTGRACTRERTACYAGNYVAPKRSRYAIDGRPEFPTKRP
jgi:hypothetical protein